MHSDGLFSDEAADIAHKFAAAFFLEFEPIAVYRMQHGFGGVVAVVFGVESGLELFDFFGYA